MDELLHEFRAFFEFLKESVGALLAYFLCTLPESEEVTTLTTGSLKKEIEFDWISFKRFDVPVEYLDFEVDGKDYRWERGETKRIKCRKHLIFPRVATARTFTIVYGQGIPDQTCCFEAREAPEDVAITASEAVLTGSGTVDTVLAQNVKRTAVILYNSDGTNDVYLQGSSAAGKTGAVIAATKSLAISGKDAAAAIGLEADAGTPTVKMSRWERSS